jgi:hypothetical protein
MMGAKQAAAASVPLALALVFPSSRSFFFFFSEGNMSSLFSFVSVSMKELPRYCLISKEISYST